MGVVGEDMEKYMYVLLLHPKCRTDTFLDIMHSTATYRYWKQIASFIQAFEEFSTEKLHAHD